MLIVGRDWLASDEFFKTLKVLAVGEEGLFELVAVGMDICLLS